MSQPDNPTIPFTIAKLIVGRFMQGLSDEETGQLDDWINASPLNMEMFGECCGYDAVKTWQTGEPE